jgi:hypothetical protein
MSNENLLKKLLLKKLLLKKLLLKKLLLKKLLLKKLLLKNFYIILIKNGVFINENRKRRRKNT